MFERLRNLRWPSLEAPAWLHRRRLDLSWVTAPLAPWVARIRERIAPASDAAHGWYEKREPREKLLLRLLALLVGVLFLYNLVYLPIIEYRANLAARVAARRNDLLEVRGLVQTYSRLKSQVAAAQHRTVANNRDFSLFSIIEETLTKTVGRDKIGSLTPANRAAAGGFRQYTVEVRLTNLTLAQIVDSLYGVQSLALPVTVSNLQIHQHGADSHSFNVELTCAAFGRNG